MILKLNSSSFEVATSILQVQIPAYKVEADYLNSTAIPRLYDTVNDIQSCVETFYGYCFCTRRKTNRYPQVSCIPDFSKGIATKP